MSLLVRILPEWEWPRLSETGCLVDRTWQAKATRGCVLVVEFAQTIVATAFVFLTADDVTHIDGLWIAEDYRGHIALLRRLHRGLKYAVEELGGSREIPVEAAVWMLRPERRGHVIEL